MIYPFVIKKGMLRKILYLLLFLIWLFEENYRKNYCSIYVAFPSAVLSDVICPVARESMSSAD